MHPPAIHGPENIWNTRTTGYSFGRRVLYHNSIFEKDRVINAKDNFVGHCLQSVERIDCVDSIESLRPI